MLRTHRPRGYQWSCPAVFQQTQLFRDISYQESLAVVQDEDVLLSDDSDDLPLIERSVKRRRIEKLADNFLNGATLQIHSARMDPQAFTKHIAWSFPRPTSAWRAMAEVNGVPASVGGWEDVDDDWEFLQKYGVQHGLMEQTEISEPSMEEEVIVEAQQSSCHRRRSRRLIKLALDPSEDALRKAAAFRNRKTQATASNVIPDSEPFSCPTLQVEESELDLEAEPTGSTTLDSYSECGPSPTPAWTSAKWRETGLFKPRPLRKNLPPRKPVDQDCSRDELGISSFSNPSQPATSHARAATKRSAESKPDTLHTQQGAAIHRSTIDEVTEESYAEIDVGREQGESAFSANPMFETAPEEAAENFFSTAADARSQGGHNSQELLLKQQGTQAKLRKSWAAVNSLAAGESQISDEVTSGSLAVASAARVSGLSSTNRTTNGSRKGRPTKSAGGTPITATAEPSRRSNRRKSAPSESQNNTFEAAKSPVKRITRHRAQYTESVPSKDTSPFMFRKRRLKIERSVQINTTTPATTPLVHEYLNRRLTVEPSVIRSTSSLRSSLRDEMLKAGAEISKAPGEQSSQLKAASPPGERMGATLEERSESQEAEPAIMDDHVSSLSHGPIPETQQPWASTQAQLAKAQHDLFTSPDKTNTALYIEVNTTPQVHHVPQKHERMPLQRMSQEPALLPSTQQLMDGWHGWSSIKKPQPADQIRVQAPSPTVSKDDSILVSDSLGQLHARNARRKSSLRYSMSLSQDSPFATSREKSSSLPLRSTALVPNTSNKNTTSSFPKPSGKIASSLSFGMSSIDFSVKKPMTGNSPAKSTLDDPFVEPPEEDATTASISFMQPDSLKSNSATESPPQPACTAPQSTFPDVSFTIPSQLGLGPPAPTLIPASTLGDLSYGPPARLGIASQSQLEDPSLNDLSFGATETGTDLHYKQHNGNESSFQVPLSPSFLKQNAPQPQRAFESRTSLVSNFDSQDLDSTINELAKGVLEEAASFSF